MSVWPQGARLRWRPVYPWPCLRCAHLNIAVTVARDSNEHGSIADECSIPSHNYLLLASLDAHDCDDFEPRE